MVHDIERDDSQTVVVLCSALCCLQARRCSPCAAPRACPPCSMSLSASLSRCSVESASTTRILVLPVGGPMARTVWENYLSELRRLGSQVSTSNLTYHAPSKDTPFKTINWRKGRMRFEFIDGAVGEGEAQRAQLTVSPPPIVTGSGGADSDTDSDADESDPAGGAASSSLPRVSCPSSLTLSYDWDELLVYKKIMAVICLCYCPTARGWTNPDSAAAAAASPHQVKKPVDPSPLAAAYEQFTGVRASLLHPGGPFIYKCYAFEGSSQEIAEKREHWAYFPSTQLSGAAHAPATSSASPLASSSADDAQLQSHWEFFLQTCLYDLAAGLLDNFEASIKKLSPNADLKSPLEAAAGGVGVTSAALLSGGSSSSSAAAADAIASRNKKVRPGRQKKYVGDYCLLAADPVSALKHFKAAADLAKSAADPIWHACALVGVADCFAAMGGLEGSDAMDAPTFLEMVVELYEEALGLLSRVPYASLLSIENSFKLARYFFAWGKRCESADVILRMYELKMDCSAHDQISLAIEAAILCHTLGFKRKFGFFLVQAAGLYRELHQSASCHALLKMATPVFRIDGFTRSVLSKEFMQQQATAGSAASEADQLAAAGDPAELALWARTFPLSPAPAESMLKFLRGGGASGGSADRRAERGFRSGGLRWVFIQKSLLEHLIFSAKQMQDELLTAGCTSYLLRTLHPWLDASYQSSIVSDLWAAARSLPLNLDSIEMDGLPVVHYLRPLQILEENKSWIDPNPGAPQEQQEHEGGMGTAHRLSRAEDAVSGDVFLSRPDDDDVPLSKRKPHRLRFVAGEPLDVEVFLANPLKVPLQLQRVSLATSGVEFEPFAASITLAPETECQRILLSGLPKAPGQLCIRGVHIRVFNLLQEHRVTAVGQGIRPLYDDLANSSYCAAVLCTEHPVSVSDLEFVAALPKLSVSYSMAGNMHQDLLLGERRRAWLLVHNVGPLPVDDLELKFDALFLAGSAQAQSSYYNNPDEIEEIKANTALRDAAAAVAAAGTGLASATRKNSTPLKSARGASGTGDEIRSPTRKLTADAALKRLHSPSHSSISGSAHAASSSTSSSHPIAAAAAVEPPKRLLVTFDPAVLAASLPLRSGCLLRIPLDLSAHVDCCGARFVLSYAESKSSRNFRATTLPISWKVESGLELRNFHVEHFVSPANNSSSTSSHNNSRTAPPSLTTDATSPSPAAASFLPPVSHLSSELAELTTDDCMLILELTNHSASASFRLSCTVDGAHYKTHSLLIDKQCDKRLILPLPRMSLGDAAADRYLRRLAQATEADPSASAWQHDALYKSLLARFHERVKLTWTSSDESHGVLVGPGSGDSASCDPASPADVSPVQLERLLPDPVRFEATLTTLGAIDDTAEDPVVGSPVFRSPQPASSSASASASVASASATPLPVLSSATRALVGRFHLLRVCARNVSSEPLRLSLTIHPFQETVNGHRDTEILRSSLLVGGSLTRGPDTLNPGDQAILEMQVAFTAVGRFQFQFVATQHQMSAEEKTQAPSATLATAAASISASGQDDTDPFALLESLAQSFPPASAASSSSALASPASHPTPPLPLPSPLRTVRRRSMLPSDAAEMTSGVDAFPAAAAADASGMESTMQRAATQRAQFQLDVESDSEAEEDETVAAATAGAPSTTVASASAPSLCYRCRDLMVVQACLQL